MENLKKIIFLFVFLTCLFLFSCIDNNLLSDEKKQASIDRFISRYFKTWSNKDIHSYKNCFHEGAVIQFIRSDGGLITQKLEQFINEQEKLFQSFDMVEIPLSKKIEIYNKNAAVTVQWKLTTISSQNQKIYTYGYDHFLLTYIDGQWKIVSLVFYEEVQ